SKKNAFGVRCNRNLCGSKLFLKVTKTAEIIRFPLFSGANDVTRTHDLLITKCIRALRLLLFKAL
ncbi:hypothetical protein, partial [Dysosmobacter sp.]|uniref:hypothetical protein n=1 Tax=Dysosmobacter sp. TaxID=2591382 RepID=UPI003AB18F1F